jgi:hypothetical protein
VRCAAAIILAHTKKKEGIDPLVEALKETSGRLGECVSWMLNLLKDDEVPSKIAGVLSSATDKTVRKNAFRAITFWVTEDPKRKKNEVPMTEVVKGLDEKDKDTLLLILGRDSAPKDLKGINRIQFNFEAGKGEKKSMGDQLSAKLLPMIAHADEEIANMATDALVRQYSFMGDQPKVAKIQDVQKYIESDKKYVQLNAVKVVSRLNLELAQNAATVEWCNLDPLIPVLDTFIKCGTKRNHRLAVKKVLERVKDEDLKKKAQATHDAIADREEEE